jgi:hypothetical protein
MCGLGQLSAAGSSAQGFERMVARFNTTAPPAYKAYRRLEAGIPGSPKTAWLEAWTEFQPGRGFTYDVVREEGHEYIRNKVLRNLLESEQELIANGKPLRAALESRNYDFADGGLNDDGTQRVILTAVRKGEGVVNGALFLAPDASYVARIEGRLVKSPSFWVRDVDVTWKYARIDGHVLPVEMTSSGRVRMFGRSNFRMIYHYVSIDGRPTGAGLNAALRDEQ